MIGNFHGILGGGGVREICNHNLRFRHPSKSNICLICHCNKINDVLSTENSGKRKLSSANIREITHQFRILNSVLDVSIEESLVEKLLSPVLQTLLAALKIHNDEVGAVVSQALEKVSPKVSSYMLENFLEKLSAQILEKTSFGNLGCLSVLVQRKECQNSFLKNYGSILLPSLLKLLESHVPRIIFKRPIVPSSASGKPSAQTSIKDPSIDCSEKESLMLVEKLFDVLEASCPSDISMVVTDNESGGSLVPPSFSSSGPHEYESFQIFSQYMKEIMDACMSLLSYSHSSDAVQMTPFHVKVLRFLEKLYHYPETLRFIFSGITGVAFCSTIKRLLYTHSVDVKTAALSLVYRMLVTYKLNVQNSGTDNAMVADFPSAISQVDLIHFITEAMNTSSENLFRTALQVLDEINSIPLFRQGRMIPVLESTLRISMMRIPDNVSDLKTYLLLNSFLLNIFTSLEKESVPSGIYHQMMYLFERLPKEWTASQYLPWIKLLIFCGREPELQGNLWNVFVSFVHRSKNLGNFHCVAPLKCVLLIACALMECKLSPNEELQSGPLSNTCLQQKFKMMLLIMDTAILPALVTLLRHGKSDDSIYVIIILELLKMYPEKYLTLDNANFSDQDAFRKVKVVDDSAEPDQVWTKDQEDRNVYQVQINPHSAVKMDDGFWCWTPKVLMQVLGTIRLNSDLVVNRRLYESWNENVAGILAFCCTHHLPQIHTTLNITCDEELQSTLKLLLGELDIDATTWSQILESHDEMSSCASYVGKSKLQDVVLAFYFCYALFAGKDVVQFFDGGFVKRLSNFLENCMERYNETQEVQEFGWTAISFYFRVGLIIASYLPRNSKDAASLCQQFRQMALQVMETGQNFKYDVMTYNCNVFIFLFREQLFTAYEQLVQIWLLKDKKNCISFFSNTNYDAHLNTEINNCLLGLAARGNGETSALAVEFGCKRLKKLKIGFEFTFFMTNIHELMRQISEETVERSRNSINLLRLCNVMQLAVQDEFLHSPDNHFPLDFLHRVVSIMLKFHDVPLVGRKSLELLTKILRDDTVFKNVSPYLTSHGDFIRFLGGKLHNVDSEAPEESVYAHKLLTLLIRQKMQVSSTTDSGPSGVLRPMITWKLASVLSYIHDIPKIEIWEFIATIFKVNFKCELIQVEELNSPSTLAASLLNLLFHVQALTHKVTSKAVKDLLWEILCEYLRLASDGNKIVSQSSFQSNVLFQPWMKVMVGYLLSGCKHAPSKLSLKPLEFMQTWTKMMLKNKLENPTKRSRIQENLVFSPYINLFKTISNAMKGDRSQVKVGPKGKENQAAGSSRCWRPSSEPYQIFDIEQKTVLIGQIAKNCEIFLSSF